MPVRAAGERSAGIPASAGIAIGPIFRIERIHAKADPKSADDPAAEQQRLRSAIARAQAETRRLYDWTCAHAGAAEAGIFDAQSLLLEDPELIAQATRCILQDHRTAEWAWQTATGEIAARLESLPDPYLRARAADVGDVAARVLRILSPATETVLQPAQAAILAAHDLTPSEVQDLDPTRVLGLCLETGSASAHSIILARAMGIPAIVGVGPAISALPDGTTIAIDGETGEIWISPSAAQLLDLARRREAWQLAHRAAGIARHQPAARAMAVASAFWPTSAPWRKRPPHSISAPKESACCAPSFCSRPHLAAGRRGAGSRLSAPSPGFSGSVRW